MLSIHGLCFQNEFNDHSESNLLALKIPKENDFEGSAAETLIENENLHFNANDYSDDPTVSKLANQLIEIVKNKEKNLKIEKMNKMNRIGEIGDRNNGQQGIATKNVWLKDIAVRIKMYYGDKKVSNLFLINVVEYLIKGLATNFDKGNIYFFIDKFIHSFIQN